MVALLSSHTYSQLPIAEMLLYLACKSKDFEESLVKAC